MLCLARSQTKNVSIDRSAKAGTPPNTSRINRKSDKKSSKSRLEYHVISQWLVAAGQRQTSKVGGTWILGLYRSDQTPMNGPLTSTGDIPRIRPSPSLSHKLVVDLRVREQSTHVNSISQSVRFKSNPVD